MHGQREATAKIVQARHRGFQRESSAAKCVCSSGGCPEQKKETNTPGNFRPGVFFLVWKYHPLPLRTPRGVLFHQKCSCAPGGCSRRILRYTVNRRRNPRCTVFWRFRGNCWCTWVHCCLIASAYRGTLYRWLVATVVESAGWGASCVLLVTAVGCYPYRGTLH